MENAQKKTPLQPTLQQSIKLKGFTKEWHLVESPQIIDRICQLRKQQTTSANENKTNNIEDLLHSRKSTGYSRISDSRKGFRNMKVKLLADMQRINKEKEKLTLSELLLWKQQILSGFLTEFMEELSKQCREKAELLSYIWNTMFNLLEYIFQALSQAGKAEEQNFLATLLQNHKAYQQVIANLRGRLSRKDDVCKQQDAFITALVGNLRYKRKEVDKLGKHITIFTSKLNEFKDCYLDLQSEHIDLLCESRDISKHNAMNLLARKQEINLSRRKEFKLKQSKKKNRKQIQAQIKHQNEHQKSKVDILHEQLRSTFQPVYQEKKKLQRHVSFAHDLFDTPLQNFNYRIDDYAQTQTILSFKNNIAFTDVGTDMSDFKRDIEEMDTQTSYNDFHFEGLISTTGVQTVSVKNKVTVIEEYGCQVQDQQLKNRFFGRYKVIDKSYLLRDYREKFFKAATIKNIQPEKDSSIEPKVQHSLNTASKMKSVMVQTRKVKFGNEQGESAEGLSLSNSQSSQNADNILFGKKKASIEMRESRSAAAILRRGMSNPGSVHSASTRDLTARQSEQSSRLISSRAISARRNKRLQSSSRSLNTSQIQRKRVEFMGESIRETNYQQMTSAEIAEKQQQENIKRHVKFWTSHTPGDPQATLKKQRLMTNLNRAEKLMFKKHSSSKTSNYLYSKKLLTELSKLSQQIQDNKLAIEDANYRVEQNLNILRQELRQMLARRQRHRQLPLSRKNNLHKIISMVYTYAYHLFFDHKQPLQSLLVPLFHYFKIGYGELKKNDLFLRMLYFLSQVICHKNESALFKSFVTMLDLDLQKTANGGISKQTTGLYLRLLHALSLNFTFPLHAQLLYTVMGLLKPTIKKILEQQGYNQNVIGRVIDKIQARLTSLLQRNEQNDKDGVEVDQIKLNIYQCCHMVLEELSKGAEGVAESYREIYETARNEEEQKGWQFCQYVLGNGYMHKEKRQEVGRKVEKTVGSHPSHSKLDNISKMFFKLGVYDFNQLYHHAISKFKLKQDSLITSVQRRVPFLFHYLKTHQSIFPFQYALLSQPTLPDKPTLPQPIRKRMMVLGYLRIVQRESEGVLAGMLGQGLGWLGESDSIDMVR